MIGGAPGEYDNTGNPGALLSMKYQQQNKRIYQKSEVINSFTVPWLPRRMFLKFARHFERWWASLHCPPVSGFWIQPGAGKWGFRGLGLEGLIGIMIPEKFFDSPLYLQQASNFWV